MPSLKHTMHATAPRHLRLSSHPCQMWLLMLQPSLRGGAAQPGSESSQEHTNPCELHSLAKNAVWHSKLSTSFSSRTRNRFFLQTRDYLVGVGFFFYFGCQYKASWRGVTVMTESCSEWSKETWLPAGLQECSELMATTPPGVLHAAFLQDEACWASSTAAGVVGGETRSGQQSSVGWVCVPGSFVLLWVSMGRQQENEMSGSLLKLSLTLRNGLIEGSVSGFPEDFYFIQVS